METLLLNPPPWRMERVEQEEPVTFLLIVWGGTSTLDQTMSLDLDVASLVKGAPDSSPVNLTHCVLFVLLHLAVLCPSIVKEYFGEYMYWPKTYTE